MAKFDKELFIKHHFWILLPGVLLFLAVAWAGIFFGVGDATAEQLAKNESEKKSIDGTKTESKGKLNLLEDRKKELFKLRTDKWEQTWNLQKEMYTWPTAIGEDRIKIVEKLKFGDEIKNDDVRQSFRDHYIKEYQIVADKVAPMQFNGGWRTVLRHVSETQWQRIPDFEDIWLALEDLWVQRELIYTLSKVNQDAAKFTLVGPKAGEPNTKVFRNRTWEVELRIDRDGNAQAIKGAIKNITSRIQPLGIGASMTLKIWIDDAPNTEPIEFVVEGTTIEAGKQEPIKYVPKLHKLNAGVKVKDLLKVEQVFDARTVPLKRLERLNLGQLSARHSQGELEMSPFSKKLSDAQAAALNPTGTTGMPGSGMMGGPAGPPRSAVGSPAVPSPIGPGIPGSGTGTAVAGEKSSNGLVRARYFGKTDQVRRMPIAFSVVVDQTYIQDVMLAMANTRLRWQTTQTHWQRFTGSLNYTGNNSSFPGSGMPAGSPESMPAVSVPMPMAPTTFAPTPITGSPMTGVGFPAMGFPGSGSSVLNSREDQLAASLVEFSVYGLATLYEKFEPTAAKK